KRGKVTSRLYLAVAVIISAALGIITGEWLWPGHATFLSAAMAATGGIIAAGLSLFLFWAGAGGFDRYVIDGVVNASAYLSGFGGLLLRKFQTGKVQNYILFAVMGAMVLYFLFRLV
ncbi:MAG: hypothetical protein OEV30_04570, partial [Ignavibacteria bacterium]|nr:hypothetical protein [Ignavibacteria bacterium]